MSAAATAALAERVAAACACAAAGEAARAAGAALGAAARCDAGALDAVLALLPAQRRARLFDRCAFAAAALGSGDDDDASRQLLPLRAAVLLSAADALLLQEEYLAPLPASHAPALADELLSLAEGACLSTPAPPSDDAGSELAAAAAALVAAACGAPDAPGARLAADALESASARGSPAAWRAVVAAGAAARPRAAARRFLLAQLAAALRCADADVALLDVLADALGPGPVLNALRSTGASGAGAAAALARLLVRRPDAAPAAADACRELASAALSAGDERAAGAALRCAQALPSYGAWLAGALADVAPAQLRCAVGALLALLPRDAPAALAAQAHALEALKRQRDACADYVGNAKRRRAHLLAKERDAGLGGALTLGPTSVNNAAATRSDDPAVLEAEAQAVVAAFAAGGGLELPTALRSARDGVRRPWFDRRLAPALLSPPAPPPQREARGTLIELLCAAGMMPRAAAAAFRRRCAALEAGGAAAAELASRSGELVPAVRSGPPSRAAAAARALGPAARAALAEAESKGMNADAAARSVADELLRAWGEAHAAEAGHDDVIVIDDAPPQVDIDDAPGRPQHAVPQPWRAAAAAAVAATSPAVHAALLLRLRRALQLPPGGTSDGDAATSAEAAAAMLAQMAVLRPTLQPVHAWAFATSAPMTMTWLADALFPEALRSADDVAVAARAAAAYLAAAPAAAPLWAPAPRAPGAAAASADAAPRRWSALPPAADGDDDVADAAMPPPLVASVPPALLHRAAWLRAALRAALPAVAARGGGAGAAACLRRLEAALDSAPGRAALAAAGDTPDDVAARLDASRFDF